MARSILFAVTASLLLAACMIAAAGPAAAQGKAAEQALRGRVERYYKFLQAGQWSEAEKFVAKDSKANFREQPKTPPAAYEYESATIDGTGKTATVFVNVQGSTVVGTFMVPVQTSWRLVKGTWYIEVPKRPSGALTGRGIAPKALPPDVRFEPADLDLGAIGDQAIIERRIRLTNVSDHAVTLETFVPGENKCLKVTANKTALKPQEDAELVARFEPAGCHGFFAQSIAVRTNPGARLAFVKVSARVGSGSPSDKPWDAKP